METITDCRTGEGITVGLIDAMLTIAHALVSRDLDQSDAVREALKDLRSDKDLRLLLHCEPLSPTEWCECGFRYEARLVGGALECTKCGKTISCDFGDEQHPASMNHFGYDVCDKHCSAVDDGISI